MRQGSKSCPFLLVTDFIFFIIKSTYKFFLCLLQGEKSKKHSQREETGFPKAYYSDITIHIKVKNNIPEQLASPVPYPWGKWQTWQLFQHMPQLQGVKEE